MAELDPTYFDEPLAAVDPEIAEVLQRELERQQNTLEMIASENFVPRAILEATGSVLTNKYAEGLPGKRYYGGCEWVDVSEQLAIDRAKELFGADHANVQPHSGAQANGAVFFAFLEPGDTFLGMDLSNGGHLTHGSPVNFSGKTYKAISYGVKENGLLDYEQMEQLARQHKPKMIIAGYSAYSRTIDFARFAAVAKEVGALFMVDMAHFAGLVATGYHPSPVPYADVVTTTTHKTLRGPRGGMILCKAEHAKAVDKAVFPGTQGGPLMHVIAAKAVSFREALQPGFKSYCGQIIRNAQALATALAGHGFQIVSGGTDNHLMLVDLRSKGVTGKVAEKVLGEAGITVNKNTVPKETQSPFVTSGIRIGTPAVTTRGMKEEEMGRIASFIDRALASPEDAQSLARIKQEVKELANAFPLYTVAEAGAGRL